MKTRNIKPRDIKLLTVFTLLLMAGCTEDTLDEGRGQVPISLTATVECDSDAVYTRAGTGVLNSFANGDAIKVYFPSNVRVGGTTSASSTTYSYNGSSWSPATQPYFNAGASSCTVHAYYPSGHTNSTSSFSVQQDQSGDANYKSSDLMYATATITKSSPSGSLTFAHRMAKIIVNATAGAGVSTITDVRIIGGYRTINISTPQSCALGTTLSNALSTSSYITMYSGGSSGSASCAAMIPPQSISGSFLQVVTNQGTATYSLPSSKSFESAKSYQLDLTVNATVVGTTSSISAWTGTGIVTVNPSPWTAAVSGTYTYNNGSAIVPAAGNITVTPVGGGSAISSSKYSVYCENNTNAGTAKLLVYGKDEHFGKFAETTFTIGKAAGYITLSSTADTRGVSLSGSFTVKSSHGGTISAAKYSGIALTSGPTVSGNTISYTAPSSAGSTVIRVTCAETTNYQAAIADYNLTTNAYCLLSSATSSDIGKVICSNGHIHNTVSAINCSGTPSAMIAYVGNQNGENGTSAYSSTYNHGLAIALSDAINSSGDKQTSSSSTKIVGSNAVTAGNNYKGAKPAGVTWRLPSAYQWERMLIACGSNASFKNSVNDFVVGENIGYGSFRSLLTTCGTSSQGVFDVQEADYWSNTLAPEDWTWTLWNYSFYWRSFLYVANSNQNYVRSCFAF